MQLKSSLMHEHTNSGSCWALAPKLIVFDESEPLIAKTDGKDWRNTHAGHYRPAGSPLLEHTKSNLGKGFLPLKSGLMQVCTLIGRKMSIYSIKYGPIMGQSKCDTWAKMM